MNPLRPAPFVVPCIVALSLLASCGGGTSAAATVGAVTITDTQLATEAKLFTFVAGLSQQKCGTPESGETQQSACNRYALGTLIVASLAAHYATGHNVSVTDAEVSDTIRSLDTRLGADTLNKALSSNSLTRQDLNHLVHESLLINGVETALAKAQTSDAQLHTLYEKETLQFTTIDVEHILVKTKAKAEQVYAQVTAPGATEKDFKALAKKVSTDTQSGANGGDLGSQPASQYVQEFANAAVALEPGQISKPVQSQFGWHVIRMISKKVTPFAQASSQILQGQGSQALTAWLQTEAKTEGVTVDPRFGRFNPQTLAIDRISSTQPTSAVSGSTGPSGSTGSGQASPSP